MDRYWQEYLRSGEVAIRSSVLKGVFGMVGMAALAALSIGIALAADEDFASIDVWGGALAALLCLLGVAFYAFLLIRRRRLILDRSGLTIESWRGGRRQIDKRLAWEVIASVEHHVLRSEGSTRTEVRVRMDPSGGSEQGHWALPPGFVMSKQDLAGLMERVRSSQHAAGR